jgi:hypothetical protein
MESEGSLLCTQKYVSGPYPQTNQVLNLKHELLKINFNIFVSSLPMSVSSQTDIFTSGCVLHFVCISHMCFAATVAMHGCI